MTTETPAPATTPAMKVERALHPKALGLEPAKAVAEAVKALGEKPTPDQLAAIRVPLGMIFGIITAVKQTIDPKSGEVRSSLSGNFEGRNIATGQIVRAPRCYLPVVQETLEGDFNSLPANVRGNRMKFQANIFAVWNEDRYGFRYAVDLPLTDTSNDPLAEMRADLVEIVPSDTGKSKGK